jgi:drug/metabolite transporter (DMT)-like permease
MATPVSARERGNLATGIGGIAILLWSALALFTSETGRVPPFELLALSFGVAFLGSAAVLASRGMRSLRRLRQPWRAWLLGFGGIFGYHALYFTALKAAPPAEASLINYLWPLLIVLFSAALPGERLRGCHVAGSLLGLAGTALILFGRERGTGGTAPLLGYAAALACAFVWSGYSVLNRRFANVPSDLIGGVCGAVALAGLACHLAFETWVAPDGGQWAAILALGVGPVGLAFFAWDHATKHGRIALLGTLSYLAPLMSTLLLLAAGQARASFALLGAAGLILCGALLAASPPARPACVLQHALGGKAAR